MKERELVLFTVDYPYGIAESSFLDEEIRILASDFCKVKIIPLRVKEKKGLRTLPSNVETLNIASNGMEREWGINDLLYFFKILVNEYKFSAGMKLLKNSPYHYREMVRYTALSKGVNSLIETGKLSMDALFYTYWFDEWTSALSILVDRYKRKIRIVTRAHGYDLYEERNPKGYLFWRKLQLKCVKQVFAISVSGRDYLKGKYPQFQKKIAFSHLGVKRSSLSGNVHMKDNSGQILVVSCSQLVRLKRLDRVISVLSNVRARIKWVHFGDGVLRQEIESRALSLPGNVEVEFKGAVSNNLVIKFYEENWVDWFINFSEYEGIPVSMMEAISSGIPIIATNVGAVSEIVNTTTGKLIAENFEPQDVSLMIESAGFDTGKRQKIIQFWNDNFNAETNYRHFSSEILSI